MPRMMGLDTAAKLLGKGALADELCISVRTLNFKINAERGISDGDVVSAYRLLVERGQELLEHARKLRAVLPSESRKGEALAYERAYFERGFIAASAWGMTKREGDKLSDDVIDHAWAHRDEGMDHGDILPVAALAHRNGGAELVERGRGS
jgi:hypothetical protein